MSGSCLMEWGGGDQERMKRLQMIDLTVAGSKGHPQINSGKQKTTISKAADIICIMAYIWMWNTTVLIGNTFCIMVLYLNMWIKYDGKRLLNNGLPWVPYHYGLPKHCQIHWIGRMKKMCLVRWRAVWRGACFFCLGEEFWCCLVPGEV